MKFRTIHDFPDLAAALQRRADIRAKLSATRAEVARLIAEINDVTKDHESEHIRFAAAAIVAGRKVPEVPITWQEQLQAAQRQVRILEEADGLSRAETGDLRKKAESAMRRERRAEHTRHVARIAEAVKLLSEANQKERAFLAQAARDGVPISSFAFAGVGDWRRADNAAGFWLKSAREHGFAVDDGPLAMAAE